MNKYTINFVCKCPKNNKPILYFLEIETKEMIMVEELIEFCNKFESAFHEEMADDFSIKFGGKQKMVANHHGVTIQTERS